MATCTNCGVELAKGEIKLCNLCIMISPEERTLRKERIQKLQRKVERARDQRNEQNEKDARDEFFEPVRLLINQHIATLTRKWEQTVYQDDYGNYLFDGWEREFNYFIDNVLRKNTLIGNYLNFPQYLLWVDKYVIEAISDYQISLSESNTHTLINVDSLDPVQFEHYCADILRSSGWDVRVTKASADQGIDLVAQRGNVRAVLQCKKYSQPVGNGAVQEIIAGKQYEQANIAAVVSNNSYTLSAKQLANATGVHLLHFTELEHFSEMAGIT